MTCAPYAFPSSVAAADTHLLTCKQDDREQQIHTQKNHVEQRREQQNQTSNF
jgi:hypothetical protein